MTIRKSDDIISHPSGWGLGNTSLCCPKDANIPLPNVISPVERYLNEEGIDTDIGIDDLDDNVHPAVYLLAAQFFTYERAYLYVNSWHQYAKSQNCNIFCGGKNEYSIRSTYLNKQIEVLKANLNIVKSIVKYSNGRPQYAKSIETSNYKNLGKNVTTNIEYLEMKKIRIVKTMWGTTHIYGEKQATRWNNAKKHMAELSHAINKLNDVMYLAPSRATGTKATSPLLGDRSTQKPKLSDWLCCCFNQPKAKDYIPMQGVVASDDDLMDKINGFNFD